MRKICSVTWIVLVLIFIYMPVMLLAVYSFTTSPQIGTIREFSLHNYVTLFGTEELKNMIIGTFALAAGSAVIATLLGTVGAIGTFYSGKMTKILVGSMNQVPVVNADVVTGFSICIFLIVFLNINKDTYIPLVIGHVLLSAPFVYLSVIPKLKQMDESIYEAALDMGATPFQALMKIVIPHVLPGILSGFVMAVTLSLDDYFIATYTKPATFDTISTYVVNATRGGRTDIKTALWGLSTLIFVVVVIAVVVMNITGGKTGNESRND